jgi:hypothetical protein
LREDVVAPARRVPAPRGEQFDDDDRDRCCGDTACYRLPSVPAIARCVPDASGLLFVDGDGEGS